MRPSYCMSNHSGRHPCRDHLPMRSGNTTSTPMSMPAPSPLFKFVRYPDACATLKKISLHAGNRFVIRLPDDVHQTIETAFQRASSIPGFLAENEIRFLGALAACTPAQGAIVEIGSFKGKSTVMLASVAARYGLGHVVAIDPHAGLSYLGTHVPDQDPTFAEFLASLKSAGVEQ